jgi:hypothetical protein
MIFRFSHQLPLEEVLIQQEQEILLRVVLQDLLQSENVSFENMKNAIIYGSNSNFCVEKFGTERMISLDKNEVVSRLKQFKSLTQFDIELYVLKPRKRGFLIISLTNYL